VKISVITTALNAAGTIRDCLESVRRQTHPEVEHVVVDAGSADGTLDILAEYQESLARVISEPDRGIYDGMNKGLGLVTGEVVGILNADDMYCGPDVLAKVARVFAEKRVESCYGDLVYIDGGAGGSRDPASGRRSAAGGNRITRYWRSGEFRPERFYWGWMVPHPTFFVRREVYERCGGFNLELGTAADYEMMLRLLVRHRITTAYLPETLIMMRAGGASNATLAGRVRANAMDRKAWEVNGLRPYPWTLWLKPLRKVGQWFHRQVGMSIKS